MIFQFGSITNPFGTNGLSVPGLGDASKTSGEGLVIILNNLLKFTIVVAGLFTFWNIIAAGYGFMSAGDDSKAVGKAWQKFTMSILGLTFVAGSFVLAAIFGWLIFRDPTALISPKIFGPEL